MDFRNGWCVRWKSKDSKTNTVVSRHKMFKTKQQASSFVKSYLVYDSRAMNIHMHTVEY